MAGALLERCKQSLPIAPASVARHALGVKPGAEPEEVVWGQMLLSFLRNDLDRCMQLFTVTVATETVGALMAHAVVAAAELDQRSKARLN